MTLIMWSGGLDSSLLLTWVLKHWYGGAKNWEGSKELTKKDLTPRTIAIENSQLGEQFLEKQEKSRNKLKRKFDRKNWPFNHVTLNVNSEGEYRGTHPQPIMWLSQASLIIENNEPLFIGWIRGDDATAKLSEYKKLWKYLTKLNGKKSKLCAPLSMCYKYEIIKEAKKENIYKDCWWCEHPTKNGRRCKGCPCCLTMIGAEAILEQTEKQIEKLSKAKITESI